MSYSKTMYYSLSLKTPCDECPPWTFKFWHESCELKPYELHVSQTIMIPKQIPDAGQRL